MAKRYFNIYENDEKYKNQIKLIYEKFGKNDLIKSWIKRFIENNVNFDVLWVDRISRFKENNGKKGMSLERNIYIYGEEVGKKIWNDYLIKRKNTYDEVRKKRGGKFNNGRSLEQYIKKYGEKEGNLLWIERNKKQSYRFSLEYFINNFKENGEKKYIEYKLSMDKTSEKAFIKKYGKIDGKKRYNIYILKQKENSFSYTLDGFILKYGDIGKEKYYEWLKITCEAIKNRWKIGYSKMSQNLFWRIFDSLSENLKKETKFAELNNEQEFYVFWKDKKFILVDFKVKNIIIEFNGKFWHSTEKMIKQDSIRKEWLENKGYKVLFIDEIDWIKNENNIINKCLNFIKENVNRE